MTTQRLVSREPAQWWVPFFWMLTTQGHSASALSSPPTIRFSCWGFPQAGGTGRGRSHFLSFPEHSPLPLLFSLHPPRILRPVLHCLSLCPPALHVPPPWLFFPCPVLPLTGLSPFTWFSALSTTLFLSPSAFSATHPPGLQLHSGLSSVSQSLLCPLVPISCLLSSSTPSLAPLPPLTCSPQIDTQTLPSPSGFLHFPSLQGGSYSPGVLAALLVAENKRKKGQASGEAPLSSEEAAPQCPVERSTPIRAQ